MRFSDRDDAGMSATFLAAGARAATIPLDAAQLRGELAWPEHPGGIVLFAHGSGSGRLSPRNRFVAQQVREAGLATLLFDLLTDAEAADRRNVFDIQLLARRLVGATEWAAAQPELAGLSVGYFGASTGAAAALVAAAAAPVPIGAVVSRGGRPDLAGNALLKVSAPTLLLVGSRDPVVPDLNRAALSLLREPKRLVVIPGAGHLFEEPGALEAVAEGAAGWFVHYLELEPTWRRAHAAAGQSTASRGSR
jgi:putative phosphoribosyl transferase